MLGLSWAATVYYPPEDADYGLNPADRVQGNDRDRKRQRRSIFFAQPDSDSDDGNDCNDLGCHGHLSRYRGSLDKVRVTPAGILNTPYTADPLSKGACLLTPSFPRRSSSPCLETAGAFVAIHEEPNSGFRHYMEDRLAAMTAGGVAYFGIYDGHGGVDASTFLQQHLLPTIQAHLQPGCDVHDALTAAYMATNAAFRATGSIQGSTATTVILNNHHLIAANVGDSPAFVVKKSGQVCSVIKEHKIEGDEAARIAAQGVPIYRSPTGPAYMGTPDGTRWLNMSRAFGDFVYPAISCEPYVCSLDVSDGKFLVMGSDGLTERWPVAEAAQYLTEMANSGRSLPVICRSLVERSLERGSTDNISCMIVDLEAYMLRGEAAAPTTRDTCAEEAGGDERAAVSAAAASTTLQQLLSDDVSEGSPEACPAHVKRSVVGSLNVANPNEADLVSEEASGLLQLLCKEEPLGLEPRPCVLRFGQSREAGLLVSAAALASCAANALGVPHTAVPDGPRWRRVDPPQAPTCVHNGAADGTRSGEAERPRPQIDSCLADGSVSSTCSSPDVYEKQRGKAEDVGALEDDRQATPQPVQTACRLATSVLVDDASSRGEKTLGV
ncbi:hypothetical protein Vafri_8814 [Volvox africanus]|uniref:protein-serine/threonine phosphatase n=1 Tax=Volvox africanus TaxID=51714 RepID=A0A8J4EYC7_9CHLO|nr:hypothetical protein Vafri_8814 [Volvox africanus]